MTRQSASLFAIVVAVASSLTMTASADEIILNGLPCNDLCQWWMSAGHAKKEAAPASPEAQAVDTRAKKPAHSGASSKTRAAADSQIAESDTDHPAKRSSHLKHAKVRTRRLEIAAAPQAKPLAAKGGNLDDERETKALPSTPNLASKAPDQDLARVTNPSPPVDGDKPIKQKIDGEPAAPSENGGSTTSAGVASQQPDPKQASARPPADKPDTALIRLHPLSQPISPQTRARRGRCRPRRLRLGRRNPR